MQDVPAEYGANSDKCVLMLGCGVSSLIVRLIKKTMIEGQSWPTAANMAERSVSKQTTL